MSIVPASRPRITRPEAMEILDAHLVSGINECVLLGIRGYYLDSMGVRGQNDKDLYDDALIVISPDVFKTFNFNTDPAKQYGVNAAMIDAGKYPFYRGLHHGKYNALRPYPEGVGLPCTRHGVHSTAHDTNIHKGGFNSTGSAGCQTIYPPQYDEAMRDTIYPQMTKYGQKTITYLLVEK